MNTGINGMEEIFKIWEFFSSLTYETGAFSEVFMQILENNIYVFQKITDTSRLTKTYRFFGCKKSYYFIDLQYINIAALQKMAV